MKIGEAVKLVGIRSQLPEGDADLPTLETFRKCVGHKFVISGFNEIGGPRLILPPSLGVRERRYGWSCNFWSLFERDAQGLMFIWVPTQLRRTP